MSRLRYSSDSTPGISRRRRKGHDGKVAFTYRNPKGGALRDRAVLQRIRALAIPPAYEDVWICPSPQGHLQATGRDARGRKQYRYHPDWRVAKDEIKHARMYEFGRSLPKLRRMLRADLAKPGLPRDKVLALVLSLMDATCIRVGNAEYARSNGSFGLSTLLDRHARFSRNGTGVLRFPGKGGTLHDVTIPEGQLAALVRKCQHLPGQRLFQYYGDDGRRHAVDSGQVNAYLQRHLGGDFTAKDFRTWHATLRAARLLMATPLPEPCSEKACARAIKEVVGQVAEQLRNTPAVCRKSYINPVVLAAWQQGAAPFGSRKARPGSGVDALLSLLRKSARLPRRQPVTGAPPAARAVESPAPRTSRAVKPVATGRWARSSPGHRARVATAFDSPRAHP
jgi:DNA topoisomerase-1